MRGRGKKNRMTAQQKEKEAARKNRDTVLLMLSTAFLAGGIAGCLLEGKLSAAPYISGFLGQAAQTTVAPSLWRELWTVFRWPAAAVLLSLLPLAALTLPTLFFLRGFFLSYGIVAMMEGLGGTGVLWAGIVFGPTCLLAVPAFFVLGTTGLLGKSDRQGMGKKLLGRALAALPVLLVCAFLDRMVAPKLLHILLKGLAESG